MGQSWDTWLTCAQETIYRWAAVIISNACVYVKKKKEERNFHKTFHNLIECVLTIFKIMLPGSRASFLSRSQYSDWLSSPRWKRRCSVKLRRMHSKRTFVESASSGIFPKRSFICARSFSRFLSILCTRLTIDFMKYNASPISDAWQVHLELIQSLQLCQGYLDSRHYSEANTNRKARIKTSEKSEDVLLLFINTFL